MARDKRGGAPPADAHFIAQDEYFVPDYMKKQKVAKLPEKDGGVGQRIYRTFRDFYDALEGASNINTVKFAEIETQGGDIARQASKEHYAEVHNFVRQLLERVSLYDPKNLYGAETKVHVYEPDRVQVGVRAQGDEIVFVSGDTEYTIDKDFKVSSKEVKEVKKQESNPGESAGEAE